LASRDAYQNNEGGVPEPQVIIVWATSTGGSLFASDRPA
jgi:hypothetical protein